MSTRDQIEQALTDEVLDTAYEAAKDGLRSLNNLLRRRDDPKSVEKVNATVAASRQAMRAVLVAALASVPAPPARCMNCDHVEPHNGPAGDVADACTHPMCSCGFDSRGPVPAPPAERRLQDIERNTAVFVCKCGDEWASADELIAHVEHKLDC